MKSIYKHFAVEIDRKFNATSVESIQILPEKLEMFSKIILENSLCSSGSKTSMLSSSLSLEILSFSLFVDVFFFFSSAIKYYKLNLKGF